jgi:hypothetical protein
MHALTQYEQFATVWLLCSPTNPHLGDRPTEVRLKALFNLAGSTQTIADGACTQQVNVWYYHKHTHMQEKFLQILISRLDLWRFRAMLNSANKERLKTSV